MNDDNQTQSLSDCESGNPHQPSLTVGDKFVEWAEKYYKLEDVYKKSEFLNPPELKAESMSYLQVKQNFANFIDKEIRNRIAGFQ